MSVGEHAEMLHILRSAETLDDEALKLLEDPNADFISTANERLQWPVEKLFQSDWFKKMMVSSQLLHDRPIAPVQQLLVSYNRW